MSRRASRRPNRRDRLPVLCINGRRRREHVRGDRAEERRRSQRGFVAADRDRFDEVIRAMDQLRSDLEVLERIPQEDVGCPSPSGRGGESVAPINKGIQHAALCQIANRSDR